MGRISQAIEVNASIEACYRVWIDFGNYPLFIKQVERITQKGDPKVWHWKVKGPNGIPLEWDAELDAVKHENRVISWHTVRHADVAHSGAITLEALDQKRPQTLINVVIDYTIPTGITAPESEQPENEQVMRFMTQTLQDSLKNFKNWVEQRQLAQPQSV